ncbi:MAG TPA: tetratricopeptide repeat protein [Smithellaceae bacterium]|mgnify:FL=1|nr:tetratricopeptide repeat protein [Smithellaceae bacterium]
MNIKKRIAAGVVFSLFILFAATGFCQGDDRVGMDQWTRVTKEKTVGQAPDNFDSAMKRGNELAKDGRYKEAVEAFSNAVRFNPQSSEAYIGRGKARRAQKDFAGAMTDYEAAVNLKPGDKNLLITLANIKTDMRKYDEAAADLSRILASDPNNLDAVVSRGYARKQLKDYPGAKADFEKALALSPNHAFATRMLHSLGSAGQTLAPQQAQIKPLTKPLPTDATPSPSGPPPMSADLPSVAGRVPTPSPSVSAQNGKPVSPTPSLGASQAAAAGGVLQDFDPCKPDVNLSDLVWSSVEQPAQQANKPIENTSRFNDLLVFSKTRHNHPVTTAKAQLAYLMGDLSPAGQRKFDEKWSFFFQYPSDEANAYFEKMIPLLAELIKKRNQTTSAVLARDDALKDAGEAQAYGNAEVRANALMIAEQQKEILRELDGELKTLAASIEALGDPPNPLANACKSRKKHEEARKIVKDALKASIVPKKLKGETGVSYAFKPEVSEIEAGAKLHWDFGDGEVKEAPAGEVKHVFKKPGKFVIGLSLVSAATKTKVPVAEARALITGASAAVGGAGKKEDKQKFIFIEKEPFDISGLPDGCVVKVNKGEKEMPVHTGDPENTRFTFIANISCKEKIFEQGQASLEHLTKPVPFKIYATPATVTFSVDYFPPNNALYYKQTVVEGLQKLLANQQDMKRWGYEPYNFKGYGRIFGYGSVKNPLGASADRIRHEIDYYGVGQESTSIGFKINTLVGYSEDSFGIECKKDGHRCGNYEKNQIVDKFRNELREKLSVTRVTYYKDLEKFIAGIKLKSMPYAQTETDEGPAISPADLAWLDIDETGLQPEEILKRKQEALLEAEKFYRSNIEILQKNLSREQADYAREQDPDRKAAFFFRMMGIQADIQAEQDKINTLHTGKIAHTRTQYDDYVQNKFIERIKDEQEKYVKLERAAAIIRKEVNKLPPGEREKAAEFVDRHLTGKTLADLDEETIKKAGEAIFNKTQGYNEAEAAKYEEESYMWDDYLTRAERVKMAADIGMVGCSFLGGPMALSASYDISTGYFQGGIKEAATQLVLQTGAFALGKYVGAGSKAAAGADDAAAAAKAAARQSGKVSKGLSSAEELKIFQANRARGEKTVKEFENLNQSLKNAYLNKASQNEIAAIKKQIREKTIEIQADPHAKNFLKYQGDKLTQTRFNRSIKSVHKDVEKKFYEKMRKEPYKWGEFEIKEMRNASSAGSVGMDYDVGLIEKANFIKLPDGTMKRQYWLMRDGKPATRSLWQKEAQKCWNEAYEEVTLKNAERSWENLTTRIHPESYQDLAVLDGNMSKVSKDWIQQTADVTRFKAMHMLKDGSMSKFEKLQEISRGTAKDLNTKLLPVLGNMQKTKQVYAAAEHWKKVSSVLDDFGKNKIDPITAERRIAELTGGKSIPEVVDDMSYMMESFVKLRK